MNGQPRLMQELTRREALLRLGSVPFGRVVFTHRALPAIRPVNHITDNGRVVFGTHEVATVLRAAAADHGTVLAYQADDIDPMTRAGWSVVVTGLARIVDDPRDAARYRDAIRPWDGGVTAYVIAIDPEIVTGFELRPEPPPPADYDPPGRLATGRCAAFPGTSPGLPRRRFQAS